MVTGYAVPGGLGRGGGSGLGLVVATGGIYGAGDDAHEEQGEDGSSAR